MNLIEVLADLKLAIQDYEERLNHYSDQVFMLSPEPGCWSMAEVYSHVLGVCLMNLRAAELCMENQGTMGSSGLNEFGEKFFAIGHYPAGKFEAPEMLKSKVQNIHKDEARALTEKVKSRLEKVPSVDLLKAEADQRIEHPRLGFLNAAEWMYFMLIHTKHHLEQLDRIERKFSMC